MDYFTLFKVARELEEALSGFIVQRVYQGERGVTLKLRRSKYKYLNLVVDPDFSSFFMSQEPFFTGYGHFAGVAESHIRNSRCISFGFEKGERVYVWRFSYTDFVGETKEYSLILEILGKYSNLIFCQSGRILECWLKKEGGIDERSLIPGRMYYPPESSEGRYIFDVDRDYFFEAISRGGFTSLGGYIYPLPRFILRELRARGGDEVSSPQGILSLWKAFRSLVEELKEVCLWFRDGKIYPFSVGRSEKVKPNEGLASFVVSGFERRELYARKTRLLAILKNREQKLRKLKNELYRELESTRGFERFKLWGEVILIHMGSVDCGKGFLRVENPYNPEEILEIPLEEGKKPSQVAQGYFSQYSKLKAKREGLKRRLEEVKSELEFLEELFWQVSEADEVGVLEDIELVLEQQGYVKQKREVATRSSQKPKYQFFFASGYKVLVGRNSRANDYVTFKLASKDDLWLHAKGYPGAHVVVKGKNIPEDVLEKAASVAAYYSKASGSSKVDVDYTKVKYVKRMRPYRPGMVIYTNYSTVTVEPRAPEEVADVEKG